MIFYRYQDEDLPDDETVLKVSVWDWKTGDLVMLLQFDDSHFAHFTSSGT